MNNDKSLNFFQRRKIEKLLQKGLTIDMYNKAPDYVKQDERIQKKLLKASIDNLDSVKNYLFVEKLFKEHRDCFDDTDIKKFIEWVIFEEYDKRDLIRELSDEEQIRLLDYLDDSEILLRMSESAVEKYMFKIENDKYSLSFNHLKNFSSTDSKIQSNIIEKTFNKLEEKDIKKLISHSSDKAQIQFLEKHIDNITSFINMGCFHSTVMRNVVNEHKDLALTHFELIHLLSLENQLWVFEQDNKSFEFLNEDVQVQLLNSNPSLIKDCSIAFKDSFFKKAGNLEVMKKCFEFDPTLYKYISFQITRDITGITNSDNIPLSLMRSIEPISLDDGKLIDLFILSKILSAKGNLRTDEFSYFRGYANRMETTRGVDIYAEEQVRLIKKLSIEQLSKLIDIDVNYVLPYLAHGPRYSSYFDVEKSDEEVLADAKKIFTKIFPNKELDDYDEIIELVFAMHKNQVNKMVALGNTTLDFNIPIESLKLLFNKDIINSNSPILINNYYKNLFTGGDSSELFKEIIKNAYGEKAVKILDQRKELDVFAINSLEIFDPRILNNFSEEFVNDLISYNMRDFSTFLYIIKNEDDLALFKDYYSLLTKIMGENVDVMQKAITEFYSNKSLLNDIKDKNLTEEQINLLLIVILGKENRYDIKTLSELDNLNDISISSINKKLEQIDKLESFEKPNAIKDLIFSDILNVDRFNESIIDYSSGIVNIDYIFDFKSAEREIFDDEELFVLDTIVKILHKVDDVTVLKSLAEELSKDVFVKNPIIINSVIKKVMESQIDKYNSSLIDDSVLDKSARKEEYDGVKIYVLEGKDIFEGGRRIIAHSVINAVGRDFMEHESQASMSTVSAREYSNMKSLIASKPRFLFSHINSEDIMAHSPTDAGVTHNPKIIKSHSYKNVPLDQILSHESEVAFYRRTKNHEKRLTPDGRIKPSYICVVNNNDSNFSISDISKRDLEYAKKYDIPILLIKEQCYTKSGGYSL